MPTASVGLWTASADCCVCGASLLEGPKSLGGPGRLPDALRLRPWRMSEPVSRGGAAGSGIGWGTAREWSSPSAGPTLRTGTTSGAPVLPGCWAYSPRARLSTRPPEAQTGMVRLKRYWRLQVAISPAQALRQGRGEVNTRARKCFGASFRCRCPGRPRADPRGEPRGTAGQEPSHHGTGPSDEFAGYRSHLTNPNPADGEVLAQEDKDKSAAAAWRMPTQVCLHWVAHLLVADAVHWRRVGSSVREVSTL